MNQKEQIDLLIKKIYGYKKNKETHKYYDRTVWLAKEYKAFITGDGLDDKLRQFVQRESEEQFKQRVRITNHIVPPLCYNIMSVYKKGTRSTSFHQNLKCNDALLDILENFYSGENINYYMLMRYNDLMFIDPNCFVITEFTPTDGTEYAEPYPFEVYSEDAINYDETNGVLNWLLVRNTFKVIVEEKEKEAEKYTIYSDIQAIQAVQVFEKIDVEDNTLVNKDGQLYYVYNEKFVYLLVTPPPYNLSEVPAVKVGYLLDNLTLGKTFISPIHNAVPYFNKLIKEVSEMDVSVSLHAFPQKIQYVEACKYKGCHNGQLIDGGGVCPSCKGTGWSTIATTASDAITMSMPDTAQEAMSLDNIVKYIAMPTEILNFQNSHINELMAKVIKTCFNADVFSRQEIAVTATEKNIDLQSVYDALYYYVVKYGKSWKKLVNFVAEITTLTSGLDISFTVEKDFKLKSLDDVLMELKLANESNASPAVIRSLNDLIMEMIYEDDPDELVKYQTREYFNPFSGKTPEQVAMAVSSLPADDPNRLLWLHEGHIYDELEIADPTFYQLTRAKQWEAIQAKVQELIPEKIETPNLNDEIIEDETI